MEIFYTSIAVGSRASSGDTVQLKDDVHGQLIINVTFTSNRHATHFVTVPNNGETLYLNNIGLRSSREWL